MDGVLVLAVKSYDFSDEKTGRKISGAKVVYSEGDIENAPNRRGLVMFEDAAELEAFHDFRQLPGFYELKVSRRPGTRGTSKVVVTGGRYLGPAEFSIPAAAVSGVETLDKPVRNGAEVAK